MLLVLEVLSVMRNSAHRVYNLITESEIKLSLESGLRIHTGLFS